MLRTVLRLLVLTLSTALFGCDDNPNGRPLPPSGLSYPSPAVFTVSQRITPVAPTVTGVVSNYSVSPAFPAGVVLDAWSGVISGVPTEPSPLASYTIMASNEGGLTTANITITVNTAAPAISYGAPGYSLELDSIDAVLLDLGHADSVVALDRDGSRLLSVDVTGRWVLWDTRDARNLSNGHVACGPRSPNCEQAAELADLAGSTLAVRVDDGLELRAASDGDRLGQVIANPNWWKLATDGSYVAVGSSTELALLSRTGAPLLSRAGNYADAVAFASPAELRVAREAAGLGVIERIAIPAGGTTTTQAFEGAFHSWFVDGERFLTTASNTVWIYSRAGVQVDVKVLPRGSPARLGGSGDRYWTLVDETLDVYEVGASATPAASYPMTDEVIPSGTTIALVTTDYGEIGVVDLSEHRVTRNVHAAPITDTAWTAYAAGLAGKTFVGYRSGVVAELPHGSAPRYFAQGIAHDIVGGGNRAFVAVSCAIIYYDSGAKNQPGRIELASSDLQVSEDGTTLLAVARDRGPGCGLPNPESTVFAVPSETPLATFPGEDAKIRLSPDGARIAVSNRGRDTETRTSLYQNGALSAVVQGWPVAWLDDQRLLVNRYFSSSSAAAPTDGSTYQSAIVVDAAGRALSPMALPETTKLQRVGPDGLDHRERTDRAVAGNYVVFVSGAKVKVARR